MDTIVKTILCKLNRDNLFTDIQLEQIKYSILAIWGDLSKFLILLVLFSYFGYCFEYLYAFITTSILRVFIGGKHFNTYSGCLAFSSFYFFTLILFVELFYKYDEIILILLIPSTAILMLIAPFISKKSGRNYKVNIYKAKLIILFLVLAYSIFYITTKEPIYLIGPFTVIYQTIQLIIMKGEYYYEIQRDAKINV